MAIAMTTSSSNINPLSMQATCAEAQRYFLGQGYLNAALAQLAADLKSHGIDYVVIGAVAFFAHGYRRFTNNIDIVSTLSGAQARVMG
jgi:hypothetical protein